MAEVVVLVNREVVTGDGATRPKTPRSREASNVTTEGDKLGFSPGSDEWRMANEVAAEPAGNKQGSDARPKDSARTDSPKLSGRQDETASPAQAAAATTQAAAVPDLRTADIPRACEITQPLNPRARVEVILHVDCPDLRLLEGEPQVGGLFTVYHARDEADGKEYAIKVPNESKESAYDQALLEVRLSKEGAQKAPAYFRACELVADSQLGWVVKAPWVPDALTPEYLSRLTAEQRVELWLHVARAVAILHENGHHHGDLNLSNIRCENRLPVITDLSSAPPSQTYRDKFVRSITISDWAGERHSGMITEYFLAPEQTERPARLLEQTDVFHLGRMGHAILRAAIERPVVRPFNDEALKRFNDLLFQTQEDDPKTRPPTVRDLIRRIEKIRGQTEEPQPSEERESWIRSGIRSLGRGAMSLFEQMKKLVRLDEANQDGRRLMHIEREMMRLSVQGAHGVLFMQGIERDVAKTGEERERCQLMAEAAQRLGAMAKEAGDQDAQTKHATALARFQERIMELEKRALELQAKSEELKATEDLISSAMASLHDAKRAIHQKMELRKYRLNPHYF